MVFAMEPAAVGAAASIQAELAAQTGASATAGSPTLLGVMPMGTDADSMAFAAALAAVGAAYVAAAGEHAAQRVLFSDAQSLAEATTVASEATRAAAMTL
ncbi:PE family protein [Mycobacterium sp. 1245805.9]|uniref:PE family protein n=1 Tax=Mycobacterium sp. 1245805.9 TaxID=1856862 RepID=UPI0007FDBE85|nr:PE family protein [Mycobacterium sp. 1245805.9]OBI94233.1 PE family protein [Mycobacterium sp. 1245805.9]